MRVAMEPLTYQYGVDVFFYGALHALQNSFHQCLTKSVRWPIAMPHKGRAGCRYAGCDFSLSISVQTIRHDSGSLNTCKDDCRPRARL